MSQNRPYLLIDHLDKNLSGSALLEAENLIHDDQEASAEWQYLNMAVDAIVDAGLREQVSAVSKKYYARSAAHAQPAVVRTMYRTVLRVAACVLLLAGGAAVYKYSTVNASSVYGQYYSSFELNTSRGADNIDAIEKAYRDKNWAAVESAFNNASQKNNQSYFLAGAADMELKNYHDAIADFKTIIANNAKTGDDYFQDETEYYLAMAYLANHETGNALPLLAKIRADKNHRYYEKANEISAIDWKILQSK